MSYMYYSLKIPNPLASCVDLSLSICLHVSFSLLNCGRCYFHAVSLLLLKLTALNICIPLIQVFHSFPHLFYLCYLCSRLLSLQNKIYESATLSISSLKVSHLSLPLVSLIVVTFTSYCHTDIIGSDVVYNPH